MQALCEKLGYVFKDVQLLERALRHRSCGTPNNERLEFLGDAVLGFLIAEELFKQHLAIREGGLSRMRSSLVNSDILAQLSQQLTLDVYIQLGTGEEKTGGRKRPSILADAVEAMIGAIYLDGGIDKTRACVLRWYGDLVTDLASLEPQKDAKSCLQEWLQAHKFPLPTYTAKIFGEAHQQHFIAYCEVEGLPHKTQGESSSRRRAEQIAAEKFLEKINEQL